MRLAAMLTSCSLILTACDTPIGSGGLIDLFRTRGGETRYIDTSCAALRPITWSGRDTDQTIREVRAHNAAIVALCPQFADEVQR